MMYLGIAMASAATVELMKRQTDVYRAKSLVWLWVSGSVIACAADVLCYLWIGSSVVLMAVYWTTYERRNVLTLLRAHAITIVIMGALLGPLLTYYVETFLKGARGALLGSSLGTVVYSLYMTSGLLGVGPGILSLREKGATAMVQYVLLLAAASMVLLPVAAGGIYVIFGIVRLRLLLLLLVCVATPVLLTFALGFVLHWRVVGRHITPIIPFIVMVYGLGIAWWWQRPFLGKVVAVAAVIVLAYSSLSIRFAPRFEKDDYRGAAELAKAEIERGGQVWWIAHPWGALYYGLNPRLMSDARYDVEFPVLADAWQACSAPCVEAHVDQRAEELEQMKDPSLVLLSRPDIWDNQDGVGQYLKARNFKQVGVLQAFTVWRPGQ
jgi:hypothetical protein